ncbi:class I SAM-dependent methyltransferase [Actinomycetospora endophytica]|uniref:Class I SAM-dependent methyltransferase n=1 Tax=Actinomycetospora endophytica TaxID=2291215 RepID=A0ABS8PHG5_9PSEU|nr:class I SAM-dependent methyltransferase [Actinomycetospora endophytica]MCD2197377.1 class I SAM-dependent methyltransferase [Actinomycetospora endophytica]
MIVDALEPGQQAVETVTVGVTNAVDNAPAWTQRWETQQAGHVPGREEVFALMLDVVERLVGEPARVLDLGCGPGSLAGRVAHRFPDAEVVGVDADPVMLELGRRTLGDRVRWVQADLSEDGWADGVGTPASGVDAVVSSTALHWLPADRLGGLTRTLAGLLRPGGVFLDFDTLLADDRATPRLAAMTAELRRERTDVRTGAPGFEDFAAWWEAAAADPGLAPQFAEREANRPAGGHGGSSLVTWTDALRAAGFAEVDTVTQLLDRRLLAAVR